MRFLVRLWRPSAAPWACCCLWEISVPKGAGLEVVVRFRETIAGEAPEHAATDFSKCSQ
jgi:hypothetical protein